MTSLEVATNNNAVLFSWISMFNIDLLLPIVGFLVFFSIYLLSMAASVSVTRSRKWKLEEEDSGETFISKKALKILNNSQRYSLVTRLGIVGSALISGFFLGYLSKHEEFISFISYNQPTLAIFLLLAIVIFLSLILSQIFRNIALSNPEKVLAYSSFFLIPVNQVFGPFISFISFLIDSVLSFFGIKRVVERSVSATPEDITEIIEESSEAGELEKEDSDMIRGVIDISETLVSEVMTPRKDVIFVNIDDSLKRVIEVYEKNGLSRLLVVGEDLDDVKGVLIAKDLITLVGKSEPNFKISNFLRKALKIEGTLKVDDLLNEFRNNALHFAVVLDEHGGVDGIVTVEDLIEEIVGEIFDEHDRRKSFSTSKKLSTGSIIAEGAALIYELNDEYDLGIPEGEYDTLAGFVVHTLGKIPSSGELLEFGSLKLRVEEVDENRILKVKISK